MTGTAAQRDVNGCFWCSSGSSCVRYTVCHPDQCVPLTSIKL